jgi:hypothetical protein
MWKEAIGTKFEAILEQLPGRIEYNHEDLR